MQAVFLSRFWAALLFISSSVLLIGCEAGGELGIPPSAPQLVGQSGDGSAFLDWPDDPQAKLYNVYWSSGANATDAIQLFGISSSTPKSTSQCQEFNGALACMQSVSESYLEISGLTNGVTYHFTVVALGDAGQSPQSVQIDLTPRAAPATPASLQAKLGFTDMLLDWQPVGGPVSYRVYLGDSPENISNALVIDINENSFEFTDIEFDKTYYIAVSAVDTNTSLESPLSEVIEVTTFKRPQLALGQRHSCAINALKDAYCAGSNGFGQLGLGESNSDFGKTVFTTIADSPGQKWEMVAAGDNLNCAIDENAELYCWGDNSQSLGAGAVENIVPSPMRIDSDVGWLWVSVRSTHICGIKLDHTLWCWGRNDYGQLGLSVETVFYERPQQIGTAENWLSVAVGHRYTCAIKTDHGLWCWGINGTGQIGSPNISPFTDTPVQINPNDKWLMVVAGYYSTCAIRTDSTMWCWGENIHGQLGNLSVERKWVPTRVLGPDYWQWLTAGEAYFCAIDMSQSLWCWGDNWSGQIGNGRFVDAIQPEMVGGNLSYLTVAAGQNHTCAMQTDNTLWCWGYNLFGQLGNGSSELSTHEFFYSPQYSGSFVSDWVAIDISYGHLCGIRSGGTMWCWGSNYRGQLGRINYEDSAVPVMVQNHFNWSFVSTGANNTCGIKTDGSLYCWGLNVNGQVGNGKFFNGSLLVPGFVPSDIAWNSVTNGNDHTCGLKADNTAWCWGGNAYGQLGIGTSSLDGFADEPSPVVLQTPTEWKSIKAGASHTCGIAVDDKIYCWGWNIYGQLGVGYDVPQLETLPVQIADESLWKKVDANGNHTCAIRFDDTLWCWGENLYGELGVGDYTSRDTPTQVASSDLFADVNLGVWSTCATTIDGRVMCWGWDIYGLITEDGVSGTLPQQVLAGFNPTTVQSGSDSGCLINADSTVWCWGYNNFGQIGNGTAWSIYPEAIPF